MCRALKVLCAAPDTGTLTELKRATVSVHWELTGGATSIDELVKQLDDLTPDAVVIGAGFDDRAPRIVRERLPRARIVSVGRPLGGADAFADADGIRDAILGLPPVGGPVRA